MTKFGGECLICEIGLIICIDVDLLHLLMGYGISYVLTVVLSFI